ncbi:MAG: hypothetical protein ACK58L_04145 [Planctomycetota bacterium]
MKLSLTQEMLIQRCVDGELSQSETRSLLLSLDSIDGGWKSLACGLLEDRQLRKFSKTPELFRDAISEANTVKDEIVPAASSSQGRSQAVRHWWSHPLTSLSLCAAIAFVGGLLIPDFGSRSGPSLAANGTSRTLQPGARSVSQEPYRLELSSRNSNSIVPVYPTIGALHQNQPDHPLFRPNPSGEREGWEWIVVPIEDNKSMLMPVRNPGSVPMQ